MHKKSNTYSSSSPLTSGPNMTGYYMGNSPSLMSMMQTGDLVTSGDVAISRAKQGVKEIDALESAQEKEAKRQARGRLFGGVGGLAGGLLLSALIPAAAPAYLLALAAGGGTALGKGFGERLGAGRARRSEQPSDTFFYGKNFEDIDEASEEYNQGMLERAGVSGLKAGLTAGLAPGGGMYGTVQGGLRNKLLDKGLLGYSSGITPGSMPASAGAEFAGDVAIPEFDTSLDDFSGLVAENNAYQNFDMSLARLNSLKSLQESSDSLARSATLQRNLEKYYQSLGTEAPAFVNREDGGLINYENGGPIREGFGSFGSGAFSSNPANPYSYYTPPTGFDPTQDSEKGQFSPSSADTAGYNTSAQDIASSMNLKIDDDAVRFYEGFDRGEVNPLVRQTRGDLEQAKSDTSMLSAKQGFSGSGVQQQSLLDLTQTSSDIVSEAREKSAEDYQERIKEQLAADYAREGGGVTDAAGTTVEDYGADGEGVVQAITNPPTGWTGGNSPSEGTTHQDEYGGTWTVTQNQLGDLVWLLTNEG